MPTRPEEAPSPAVPAELEQALEQLEELRREAADARRGLDEYVAIVCHDLRTPLTVIGARADLSARLTSGSDNDGLAQHLDAIAAATRQMTAIIKDVAECVRLEGHAPALRKEPVAPLELVSQCLGLSVPAGQLARIALVPHGTLPAVEVDRPALARVIGSLVSNALKFSAADAPVEVRLEGRPGEVTVAVVDHGVGVPAAELPRVFDRAYRGKVRRDPSGARLSLRICRLLVEAHGGRIWAESEPGQGSTFAFTLPARSA